MRVWGYFEHQVTKSLFFSCTAVQHVIIQHAGAVVSAGQWSRYNNTCSIQHLEPSGPDSERWTCQWKGNLKTRLILHLLFTSGWQWPCSSVSRKSGWGKMKSESNNLCNYRHSPHWLNWDKLQWCKMILILTGQKMKEDKRTKEIRAEATGGKTPCRIIVTFTTA